MERDAAQIRKHMLYVRGVVEFMEARGASEADSVAGLRYDLATTANDVNGDGCAFPNCSCAKAMCEQKPPARALVSWDQAASSWRTI